MFNVFTCDVFTLRNNLACCKFIMVCVWECVCVFHKYLIYGIGKVKESERSVVTALC